VALLLVAALALACGVEARKDREARAQQEAWARGEGLPEAPTHAPGFDWPRTDGPRKVAVLHVKDHGEIRIALYPELAPRNVEAFEMLAHQGFYDGTTFHRVIPGFMIQGGDPNSKDDDPRNDGYGGPDFRLPDEFSDAHHVRGTVSMANTGQRQSGGSQFFIVEEDQPHLDGHYSVIGRVVGGMPVVDDIAQVEVDSLGRWGPKNRPIHDVVIEHITFEEMDDGELHAGL